MKKIIPVILSLSAVTAIAETKNIDGYQDLKFGQEYEETKKILTNTCKSIEESQALIKGKECFVIAGKKRNVTVGFYLKTLKLAQINFDFIKDDMVFEADLGTATNIVEGLLQKYSLDKEVRHEGKSVTSFNNSAVILIFGNTWNSLLSTNIPTMNLVYSDPEQSKKMAQRFGVTQPESSLNEL